ncbi:hypothetical protein BSLG_007147 [Batrachochytrium salamandrivorans]|nr:hypothetical protein BASA83_010161 [Batrachochytrium salamandrivorans]KAJ1336363.1 hypothetical protein BSLG_007147 [Batrachochytrium salamandrivorans]
MDQATTGRVMGAAVAQLPHTYDSRCALQHADASATRTRITTAATRTLTRASVGCTTHPYALGNSTNLRVTRPSPLFPSTVLSSLSTLVLFIMAASFGLPPVLASTTLITVHINSPSCWYKPAFMPNRGSLSDVDLLANSYDMVVPVRESNELTGQTEPGNGGFPGPISGFPPPPASTAAATNSTGQTPGSLSSGAGRRAAFLRSPAWCVLSSTTYGYYQFDTTKTSLLRYENCTDNACVNGCTLAASAAYPPPTTDDFYTNDTCNGLVYKITNPSDIPTPLPSVDAYSRYMVSSVYPFSSTSRPCSGIPRTSNLVKIYDNCTLISVPGAPLAYAISQVLDEQVSQKLCRDRTCSTCATSNSFAPWSRSNECIPRGLTRVRGLIFPQDASNSTQPVMVNPSVSDSPPSLPNAFTTPVIVAIAAAGTALLIMIGLLIWCIASRVGRKRHDNEKIPYQQQQQPSVVLPPRIATIVASSGQPQGTSVYGANHHTSNQQNAFSASKIVQILEQPHTVVVDYEPQMTDELRLVIGDQVILESVWSDGWAQAYNITSGERGTLAIATLDSASQTAPSTTTTTAY